MTRGLMAVLWLGTAVGCLGCTAQPTGLIVDLNDTRFELDELQYGVSLASAPDGETPMVLVDPSGKGRVPGRLASGARLRQAIYLNDRYGGQVVICEVTGLSNGAVVARGNTAGSLRSQQLTEVTVILSALDDEPPATADGGAPDADPADIGNASGMKDGGEGGASPPIGGGPGSGGMTGAGGSGQGSGGAGGQASGGSSGSGGMEPPAPGSGGRAPSPPPPPPPPLQKGKGGDCQRATDCASGLFCVDGVCCTAPCIGGCRRCNDPRALGDCRLTAGGNNDPRGSCAPHSACEGNGACDGKGGCARSPEGTPCGQASCKNNSEVLPAATCDGKGLCRPAPPMMKCDKNTSCVDGTCRSMGS